MKIIDSITNNKSIEGANQPTPPSHQVECPKVSKLGKKSFLGRIKNRVDNTKVNIKAKILKGALKANKKAYEKNKQALKRLSGGSDFFESLASQSADKIYPILLHIDMIPTDLKNIIVKEPAAIKELIAEKLTQMIWKVVEPNEKIELGSAEKVAEELMNQVSKALSTLFEDLDRAEQIDDVGEQRAAIKGIFFEFVEFFALKLFPNKEEDERLSPALRQYMKMQDSSGSKNSWNGLIDQAASFLSENYGTFKQFSTGSQDLETLLPGSSSLVDQLVDVLVGEQMKYSMSIVGFEPIQAFEKSTNDFLNRFLRSCIEDPQKSEQLQLKQATKQIISKIFAVVLDIEGISVEEYIKASALEMSQKVKSAFSEIEVKNSKEHDKLYQTLAQDLLEMMLGNEKAKKLLPPSLKNFDINMKLASKLKKVLRDVHESLKLLQKKKSEMSSSFSSEERSIISKVKAYALGKTEDCIQRKVFEKYGIQGIIEQFFVKSDSLRSDILGAFDLFTPLSVGGILKMFPHLKTDQKFIKKSLIKLLTTVNSHINGKEVIPDGLSHKELHDKTQYYSKLIGRLSKIAFPNGKDGVPLSGKLKGYARNKGIIFLYGQCDKLEKLIENPKARLDFIGKILINKNDELDLKIANLNGRVVPIKKSTKHPSNDEIHIDKLISDHLFKQITLSIDRFLINTFGTSSMYLKIPLAIAFSPIVLVGWVALETFIPKFSRAVVKMVTKEDFNILGRKLVWEALNCVENKDMPEATDMNRYDDQLASTLRDFVRSIGFVYSPLTGAASYLLNQHLISKVDDLN